MWEAAINEKTRSEQKQKLWRREKTFLVMQIGFKYLHSEEWIRFICETQLYRKTTIRRPFRKCLYDEILSYLIQHIFECIIESVLTHMVTFLHLP